MAASANDNLIELAAGTGQVPKPALTAADAATVDVTYGAEEQGVIINNRTRIGEIEVALRALGLLT